MWLKVTKTRALPIGIDLGTAAVKIVQLRRLEGQLELGGAVCEEVPSDCRGDVRSRLDFLASQLHRLLKEDAFTGRRCVLSLPAEATFVQHVKTAKLAAEELAQSLRHELAGKAPFDPGEAIVRHVIAGETYNEGDSGQEVIVIAASRQTVEAYLELGRRSKLRIVALDVEPCAIVECFARLFRRSEDSARATLFLDLGQANTQVVIAHGAKLVFARNLSLGSHHVDEAVGARLGVSVEEAARTRKKMLDSVDEAGGADRVYDCMREVMESIVGEITKCLRYYESVFPSKPVERAIFLGGQAADRRLCQGIAQRLNLPAQIGDPLARMQRANRTDSDPGMDRRRPQPVWAVAVGLSIGAELPEAA